MGGNCRVCCYNPRRERLEQNTTWVAEKVAQVVYIHKEGFHQMKRTTLLICTSIFLLIVTACSASPTADVPTSVAQQPISTASEPSGTVVTTDASSQILSHPTFNWTVTVPDDWTITYDSGYQVQATSGDQQVSLRLQAQRWKQDADGIPDAKSYVEHWKNFIYGDVFPLYANGTQVSEAEIGQDKYGGPYLRFEFDDSKKETRYLQVYASAGGPTSAMLTTWTSYGSYENAKNIMQDIINSFALTEASQ